MKKKLRKDDIVAIRLGNSWQRAIVDEYLSQDSTNIRCYWKNGGGIHETVLKEEDVILLSYDLVASGDFEPDFQFAELSIN